MIFNFIIKLNIVFDHGKEKVSSMKDDKKFIDKYMEYRKNGMSAEQMFNHAKIDGYKNFECIHLLMIVFDMPLDEARKISHKIYLSNK